MRDPYTVILRRYVTEKATVLENLQNNSSSKTLARYKLPKVVFLVNPKANKQEIREAIETLYAEQKVSVVRVNTQRIKGKAKRRGRGRSGVTTLRKKAIVTLQEGDLIEKRS